MCYPTLPYSMLWYSTTLLYPITLMEQMKDKKRLLKVYRSIECTGAEKLYDKFPAYFVPGMQLSTCMMNVHSKCLPGVQIVSCPVQVSKSGM